VFSCPCSRAISGPSTSGPPICRPRRSRPRGLGSRLIGAAPAREAPDTVSVKGVGTGGGALGRVALHRPGSPFRRRGDLWWRPLLSELPLLVAAALVTKGRAARHVAARRASGLAPGGRRGRCVRGFSATADVVLVDADRGWWSGWDRQPHAGGRNPSRIRRRDWNRQPVPARPAVAPTLRYLRRFGRWLWLPPDPVHRSRGSRSSLPTLKKCQALGLTWTVDRCAGYDRRRPRYWRTVNCRSREFSMPSPRIQRLDMMRRFDRTSSSRAPKGT